jgi:DNA-binding transcriptional MerR regulator
VLTIGQLASYAGVTIRAVRHYHKVGLLPEPKRDASGYRTYDAVAVLRLVRIRTLAEAGVPLARVRELLDADPATFAAATAEIDRELRERIRALREHRRRIARLNDGDSLAVPKEVAGYLDRLRAVGTPAEVVEGERDGWILIAARWPESIPALMADKTAQLADPRVVRFYRMLGRVAENWSDDEVMREAADLMIELLEQASATGTLAPGDDAMRDGVFVRLMDAFAESSHPAIGRLRELLAERGWTGWTWFERSGSVGEQRGQPGQLEDRVDRAARPGHREGDPGDRRR